MAAGLAGGRLSFLGFSATQVALDLESGYYLLRDEWPFHRFLHTAAGATVACGVAVWLCRRLAVAWKLRPYPRSTLGRLARRDLDALSSPAGAVGTAVLGVVGHLIPDGIMHFDVRPFAPFTDANPFHGTVSLSALHWSLITMGTLGALLVAWRETRAK